MEEPVVYFERALSYRPMISRVTVTGRTRLPNLGKNITTLSDPALFRKHFPLTFRTYGKPLQIVTIRNVKDSYQRINILPDYFTEYARVRDVGANETMSPYEYWIKNEERITELGNDDVHLMREIIWKNGPTEPRQGKITNYLSLFEIFNSKYVLDPSAAWGDRLIAALASKSVIAYTGVDPHSQLPVGWKEIVDILGPISGKKQIKMINQPFEKPKLSQLPFDGYYDTVLISPPPFVGDRYDIENKQQASIGNKTFEEYVINFLIPYMRRSINALGIGGVLCMTFLDRPRQDYMITELQLLCLELIDDECMHYRGVVFWEGDSHSLVPWWIFEKSKRKISKERHEEAMYMLEPYLDKIENLIYELNEK